MSSVPLEGSQHSGSPTRVPYHREVSREENLLNMQLALAKTRNSSLVDK